MIASILIILVSSALLIYWFRYSVLLLLQTSATKDYATAIASANGLTFLDLKDSRIRQAPPEELPTLQKMLERDYRLLTFLLEHTAALKAGGASLEQRLLMLDFRLMQLVCSLRRILGLDRARAAMQEMSLILTQLANAMGERIESASHA